MNISYYKLKKTLIPYFNRGGISFSVCEQRSLYTVSYTHLHPGGKQMHKFLDCRMDEIIDNQHHTAEQQGVFQADTAVNVEWIA